MFFDLNVPILRSSVERDRSHLLSRLFDYGYDCVALNTIIYGRLPKQHRCGVERIRFDPESADRQRKRREPSLLRSSRGGGGVEGEEAPLGHRATAESGPDQLTRLTVVLETPVDAQVLTAGSDGLQTYDIVAAVPCCQRSFELLCRHSDVDIISMPLRKRLPFTLVKKMTDAALARGAVFEITYSQAIQSLPARRNLFGNARSLIALTKGRGVILTSGAETALLARNPHDVANLGQLLGLTQEQSIRAVSDTPLAVIRRAEARKGRFRGLTIVGDGGGENAAEALASLQVPKEFYLPEAVPSSVKGGDVETTAPAIATEEGDVETRKAVVEAGTDEDEAEGFLSFGGGAMDVEP